LSYKVSTPTDKRGNPTATPELDRVVDAVLRGDLVLVYPPGTSGFLLSIVMLTLAVGGWVATVVPRLFGTDVAARAIAEMVGIAVVFPTTTIPAAMVAFGAPGGRKVMQLVTLSWIVLGDVGCWLVPRSSSSVDLWSCAAVLLLLLGVLFAINQSGYLSFVAYKRRLRVRRRELQNQRSGER
jgi:hypothetical protein